MVKTARARKGVTIAEITVALALVSIMIALVVTFVMLLTEQTKRNAQNDAIRRDCILIESLAERWMNEVSKNEKPISVKNNETVVSNDETYTLNFDNNTFTITYPDESDKNTNTIHTETVEKITYEILKNETSGDLLLILTVKFYDDYNSSPLTICINPHVGDTY